LREWVTPSANAAYVSLQWAANPQDMAPDKYHPGLGQYSCWARMVADKAAQMWGAVLSPANQG
jgi:hypothetical protein